MRASGLRRSIGWGVADQALSSLTNFAFSALCARTLGPTGFGAFSVAFTTYLAALGIARALVSEPLIVRFSASGRESWCRGASLATGASLVLAGMFSVPMLGLGAASISLLSDGLLALTAVLPGLLLQDCWRYAFFARKQAFAAFINDLVWALILFPAIGVLAATNHLSLKHLMLAWGGAATVAAAVGLIQTRVRPRPLEFLPWLREQRDLAPRFAGEFAAGTGVDYVALYGTSAIAGLPAVGSLRAGFLILGPLNIVFQGLNMILIPEQAHLATHQPARLLRSSIASSVVQAATGLIWGTLAYLLPLQLGRALLGSAWDAGRHVLIPLSIASAGYGAALGAHATMRALANARRSLRSRLAASTLILTGVIGGCIWDAARGAAWGWAVACWLASIVTWHQLIRALREYPNPNPGSEQCVKRVPSSAL